MIRNSMVTNAPLLIATLALATAVAAALAMSQSTTPTQEQIDISKNLPKDQQDAILNRTIGKSGSNAGKSSDRAVTMPTTVQPKTDTAMDEFGRPIKEKTRDGRQLRLRNEDPELRANDTVLIELTQKIEFKKERDSRNFDVRASQNDKVNTELSLERNPPEDTRTEEQEKRSEDMQRRTARIITAHTNFMKSSFHR